MKGAMFSALANVNPSRRSDVLFPFRLRHLNRLPVPRTSGVDKQGQFRDKKWSNDE